MNEIIVLTREQYQADMQEAAKLGALRALKEYKQGDEWITREEAMKFVHCKSAGGFRTYRVKNKIYGSDKVRVVGNRKLFNKAKLF